MTKLFDIQWAIKEALEADASFGQLTQSLIGERFYFSVDKSEIVSIHDLPAFIIHKNFASDTLEGQLYAIQFNLIVPLGEYEDKRYNSIRDVEILAHAALPIADDAVCQFDIKRETTNMFVAAPIDGADDVEWVVSVGYASLTPQKFI